MNKITDVHGVRVGHATIKNEMKDTGITVILPSEENLFTHKIIAASYVGDIGGAHRADPAFTIDDTQIYSPREYLLRTY